MCFTSTPSAPQTTNVPVEYLHNRWIDGEDVAGGGLTMGRNSLRVDLNAPSGSGPNTGPPPQAAGQTQPGTPTSASGAAGPSPLTPVPGVVVPTIGGSLAGSLPPMMGAPARPTPFTSK